VYLDGRHQLIPHNGGVILEDGVEIGANSCVDRAKFGNTVIGAGTKIDNLVQVAHNVVLGRGCLLAGQSGMGGSCRFGDGVVLAGMAGVSDNKTIGAGAMVGAGSVVFTDVEPGHKVWGAPAIDANAQMRSLSVFKRLPEMAKELKELLKRVEKLESSKND
jgi:UDP-3-O-[3-hydroxymyristoyl] glucosamine N-acyltransferase